MGCCCDKDENIYDEDQEQRTQLIGSNSLVINVQPPTLGFLQSDVIHTPVSDRSDEHTQWDSILRSTNGDMIHDVEREAVEYQEQRARSAHYKERLILSGVVPPSNPHALPAGVASPSEVAFAPSRVTQEDFDQINLASRNMSEAVHSLKAVPGKDQLVVALATFL